jgi:hypothetical protein
MLIRGDALAKNSDSKQTDRELYATMGAIQSFFSDMLEVTKGLITIVFNIARLILQPGKMIMVLLLWIICIPIYTIALIWYTVFSIPVLKYVQFWNYYFWTVLLLDLVVSIGYFLLFCLYGVIACAMWIIDLLTLGLVRFLTRCENRLDSWHTRANFSYGNTANRLLIAQLPCANRFKPTGFMCVRQPNIEPSFCAHSQIYRIFTGMSLKSPPLIDEIDVKSTGFVSSRPAAREAMVRDFYKTRKTFMKSCKGAMAPFQKIVRSICANTKTAKIKDDKHRDLLVPLCLQAFCSDGIAEPFCSVLAVDKEAEKEKKEKKATAAESGLGDVARKMAMLAVVIVLTTIGLMLFAANKNHPPVSTE